MNNNDSIFKLVSSLTITAIHYSFLVMVTASSLYDLLWISPLEIKESLIDNKLRKEARGNVRLHLMLVRELIYISHLIVNQMNWCSNRNVWV